MAHLHALFRSENAYDWLQQFPNARLLNFRSYCESLTKPSSQPYRSTTLKNIFSDEPYQPKNGARDFLFCSKANAELPDDLDHLLAPLRLYFIERALEASQLGIRRELSLDHLSILLAKVITNKSKSETVLINDFLNLPADQSILLRLRTWATRLELKGQSRTYETNSTNRSASNISAHLISLLAGNLQSCESSLTTYGESTVALNQGSLPTPTAKHYYLPAQDPENTKDATSVKSTNEYASSRVAANISKAKRIQAHKLTLGPQSKHYWPTVIHELFQAELKKLFNDAKANNVDGLLALTRAIALKASHILGIGFQQTLHLQITPEPVKTFGNWFLLIEANGDLVAIRDRPKRTQGATLTDCLRPYCYELGSHIRILLATEDQIPKNWQATVNTWGSLSDALAKNIKELKFDPTSADQSIEALKKFILAKLPDIKSFSEESIRRQAFFELSKQLDPLTAELCIALPLESTSAATGYYCRIENELNVAGSELALTKDGAARLINEIDQKIYQQLKLEDKDLVSIFNLASKRITAFSHIFLGCRAALSVLETRKSFCTKRKIALIDDKFVEDLEEIRITPICSQLIAEIERYLEFIEQIVKNSLIPSASKEIFIKILAGDDSVPFAPHLTGDQRTIRVEEYQVEPILRSLKEGLDNNKTIFRNFLAQLVYQDSHDQELCMAFLGHSDFVHLLYGPCSTRSRQQDANEILRILDTQLSSIKVNTNTFWDSLDDILTSTRWKESASATTSIQYPEMYGYRRRERERFEKLEKSLASLELRMKEFEDQVSLNVGEPTKPIVSFELAKEFLNDEERRNKLPKTVHLNTLLQRRKWGISLPSPRTKQTFFDSNLLKYLENRDRFTQYYLHQRSKLSTVQRAHLDLVYCVYHLGLESKKLALAAMDPNKLRVTKDLTGDINLEISSNDSGLKDIHNSQVFRLCLPQRMAESFTRHHLTNDHSALNLLQELITTLPVDTKPSELLAHVVYERQQISRFERPAYLSYALSTNNTPISSNLATTGSIHNVGLLRKAIKETNRPFHILSRSNSKKQTQNTAHEENIDKQLKELRDILELPFSDNFRDRLSNFQKNYGKSRVDLEIILEWVWFNTNTTRNKLKPKSMLRYLGSILHFLSLVPNRLIQDLEASDAQICVDEFEDWAEAKRDRRIHHAALRRFFMFLVETYSENFLDVNVKYVNSNKTVSPCWTTLIQYNALVRGLNKKYLYSADGIFLSLLGIFLYRFGLRINEALGLEFDDLIKLDTTLLGIVVKRNRTRDIKFDKSPRYVFLEDVNILSKHEKSVIAVYINQVLLNSVELDLKQKIFDLGKKDLRKLSSKFVKELRALTRNPIATPHSLRKGFAQVHLAPRVNLNKEFRKSVGLTTENLTSSSRAFSVLQTQLGHSQFDTTVQHYIHIFDEITKNISKGRRRGSGKNTEVPAHVVELSELFRTWQGEEIFQNSQDETTEELLSTEAIRRVKSLLGSKEILLSPHEASSVSRLLNPKIGFHPSSLKIELHGQQIKFEKSLLRRTSFRDSEQFRKLLFTVREQKPQPRPVTIESSLQEINATSGQLIFKTSGDFLLLRSILPNLSDFELEHPNDLHPELVSRLISEVRACKIDTPIAPAKTSMANEVTDESRTTQKRVRLKWKYARNYIDTWIVFMACVLIWGISKPPIES